VKADDGNEPKTGKGTDVSASKTRAKKVAQTSVSTASTSGALPARDPEGEGR
jgi:hypothetical protein